jgi:hypothetical protein
LEELKTVTTADISGKEIGNVMKFQIVIFWIFYIFAGQSVCAVSGSVTGKHVSGMSGAFIPADTIVASMFSVRPFNIDIVPPSSGVQFFKEGIIFLSHSDPEEKMPQKHVSFGALKTYMTIPRDTVPGTYIPFILNTSIVFPSEATTFTSDFRTMYLSLIPERGNKEKIFRASGGQEGWTIDKTPLEFCTNDFIYSHPALSTDGTFMVFSSDMTGSTGGIDLFITKKKGEGWTQPENLGKNINSQGNEIYACLDGKNNLYFSSDGIPGKGGYDIFVCLFNGLGWDKPQNLPAGINSMEDEIAFTINRADDQTAYFTSRTREGKTRTQLYCLSMNPDLHTASNTSLSDQFFGLTKINDVNNAPKPEQGKLAAVVSTENTAVKETLPEEKLVSEKPVSEKPAQVVQNNTAAREEKVTESEPATTQEAKAEKDIIVYRVQILANEKPSGSYAVTVAGKNFKTFEYLYKGAYRTTVGEFGTLAEAVKLQNECRHNGFSQAFVVAFKNNIRSTDPALFK